MPSCLSYNQFQKTFCKIYTNNASLVYNYPVSHDCFVFFGQVDSEIRFFSENGAMQAKDAGPVIRVDHIHTYIRKGRWQFWTAFDEALKIHGVKERRERYRIASEMMEAVNLRPDYLYRYPHEFSGGQLQRICIARCLALNPKLIVCDEPVSALDVSVQAQILNLMRRLQKEYSLTYIFIAHDISVVEYMSTRIAVMYLGKIVETATGENFSTKCMHPYAQALMSAIPIPVPDAKKDEVVLSGDVPSPIRPPKGCRFHPRCRYCTERCKTEEPELVPVDESGTHLVACHYVREMLQNRLQTAKKEESNAGQQDETSAV